MIILLTSCAYLQPHKSISSTIIIKTPTLKFYDTGFISYYDDYIHLQLLSVGNTLFDISIYKEKICESTFKCIPSSQFNQKYLDISYKDDFLYNLLQKKRIYFKDIKKKILIKVK